MHGLTTTQKTLVRWSPMAHFVTFLALLPRNFPTHIPLGADVGGPTLLDQLEEEVTLIH